MEEIKEHFYQLFVSLSKELFALELNGELLINDDRIDIVNEIISLINTEPKKSVFGYEFETHSLTDHNYNFKTKSISKDSQQYKSSIIFNTYITTIVNILLNLVIDDKLLLENKKNRNKIEEGIKQRFQSVNNYLQSVKSYNDLIWNLPLFDDAKKQVKDEIYRALYKPKGGKVAGQKCPKCKSEELWYRAIQTRAGDEGMSSKYKCTACSFEWMVR